MDLGTHNNPWISNKSDLSPEEQVIKNQLENDKFFYNTHRTDPRLKSIIEGKRVALVGPAPYLCNTNQGSEIDNCDIVIRMDGPATLGDPKSHGKKMDGIGSNLGWTGSFVNFCKYINTLEKGSYPKFVINSDSAIGSGKYAHDAALIIEKKFHIPVITLEFEKKYADRSRIFWEVYPKNYKENLGGKIIHWNPNIHAGYGIINMLLGYDIKELYISGMDFYNLGKDIIDRREGKLYSKFYQKYVGPGEGIYRKNTSVHDCLSQISHLKNVLLRKKRNIIRLDEHLENLLNNPELDERLKKHSHLKNSTPNKVWW